MEVLVREGGWRAASLLTVRLRLIPGTDWELATRQRVRFHLGTAELLGRVRLLEAERLRPGDEGWAQILLEAPVVARAGDRFVLRSYSPVTTIGGGVVFEPEAGRRKRLEAADAVLLARLLGPVGDALTARAQLAGALGAELGRLPVETPHSPSAIEGALRNLQEGAAPELQRVGERVYAAATLRAAQEALLAAVDAFHAQEPLRPGIDRHELRSVLARGGRRRGDRPATPGGRARPPSPRGGRAPQSAAGADVALADRILEALLAAGTLVASGPAVARAGFAPTLSPEQSAARERLAAIFEQAALASPALEELPAELRQRKDFWPLLKLLEGEGRLLSIAPESYVWARALQDACELIRERLAGQGPFTPADFKAVLPLSRKHLIPLLEYFDRSGITVRKGNERYLPEYAPGGAAGPGR